MLKCYAVSLEKDKFRRDSLIKQFTDHPNVQLNIIDAIEGKTDPKVDEIYNTKHKEMFEQSGCLMNHGEIACFLSHQKALKEFLKTDDKQALFVEDDVVLKDEFWESLGELIAFSEENPGIYFNFYTKSKKYFVIKDLKKIRLIQHISNGPGTACYLIDRSLAKLIVEAEPFLPSDQFSKNLVFYNIQHISPLKALAGTLDFESAIDEHSLNKRKNMKKLTKKEFGALNYLLNKLRLKFKYQFKSIKFNLLEHGFLKLIFVYINFNRKSFHKK